jgi:hypothetical protein
MLTHSITLATVLKASQILDCSNSGTWDRILLEAVDKRPRFPSAFPSRM